MINGDNIVFSSEKIPTVGHKCLQIYSHLVVSKKVTYKSLKN